MSWALVILWFTWGGNGALAMTSTTVPMQSKAHCMSAAAATYKRGKVVDAFCIRTMGVAG